jgi:multidrug efflux pump subunit AcrA (membrane-fusion protein)
MSRYFDILKPTLPVRVGLTAALFVASLQLGCSSKATDDEKAAAVPVQTAMVEQGKISKTVTAQAVLFPLNQTALTPKITSPISKFLVNRGSHVHRGQLVAILENQDLKGSALADEGSYQQAQADFATANATTLPEEMQKAEFDAASANRALEAQQKVTENRRQLFKEGAIPRKDLNQSEVDLIKAQSDYEIANRQFTALQSGIKDQRVKSITGQLNAAKGKYLSSSAMLGYSEIHSPIDGVVTERPLYPGDTVTAGESLMTIMDLSAVIAKAHIPQEDAALLKAGDAATITIEGSNEEVPAKLTLVSPALDPNSTTVEIWAQAKNPKGKLRPGSSVGLSVVAENVPGALLIPTEALLKAPDGTTTVMVFGADGHAHQQAVEVGITEGDKVQITKGLAANDRIITAGAYGLPDNAKVTLAEASAPDSDASKSKKESDADEK